MTCLWLVLIACGLVAADVSPTGDINNNDVQTTEAASQSERPWYCPDGWVDFSDGQELKCIYFSDETSDFYGLDSACKELNAKQVEIFTESKNKFLIDRAVLNSEEYILPLVKNRGYGQSFYWEQSSAAAEEYFISNSIVDETSNFKQRCVYISGYSQDWDVDSCDYNYHFMCEKEVDCVAGTFGPGCETKCHCAGEPCDTSLGPPTCKWGCEQGWTGDTCSTEKEHPEVRYFCIKSPEEHVGSYVGIHIYTKGVNYRSIYAVKGNSTEQRSSWCPGTTVTRGKTGFEHVDITMWMNDTVAEEIRQGNCAGQEVVSNHFEWTLVIQEYEGILLDTDLQVVISCDFNASETLQRSADFSRSDSQAVAEKIELVPESADVTLEVVDPFTEQVITEASVGNPAKLQIKFGYEPGSLVRGVNPHHCVATTPDNSVVKSLLDDNGCPNKDSPVQPFSSDNTTTSISTVWFPLFAFAGQDQIEFKCSFDLCFSTSECHPGCSVHDHHNHRHRRAAVWPDNSRAQSKNVGWRSSVIRILPDFPSKEENVFEVQTDRSKPHPGKALFHNSGHDSNIIQGDEEEKEREQQQHQKTTTPRQPTSAQHAIYTLLNPITCGVLLLLLVLLTSLFLVFHFSLRRNVEDMRREMLERRSRDDFRYCSADLAREKDWVTA